MTEKYVSEIPGICYKFTQGLKVSQREDYLASCEFSVKDRDLYLMMTSEASSKLDTLMRAAADGDGWNAQRYSELLSFGKDRNQKFVNRANAFNAAISFAMEKDDFSTFLIPLKKCLISISNHALFSSLSFFGSCFLFLFNVLSIVRPYPSKDPTTLLKKKELSIFIHFSVLWAAQRPSKLFQQT